MLAYQHSGLLFISNLFDDSQTTKKSAGFTGLVPSDTFTPHIR